MRAQAYPRGGRRLTDLLRLDRGNNDRTVSIRPGPWNAAAGRLAASSIGQDTSHAKRQNTDADNQDCSCPEILHTLPQR